MSEDEGRLSAFGWIGFVFAAAFAESASAAHAAHSWFLTAVCAFAAVLCAVCWIAELDLAADARLWRRRRASKRHWGLRET